MRRTERIYYRSACQWRWGNPWVWQCACPANCDLVGSGLYRCRTRTDSQLRNRWSSPFGRRRRSDPPESFGGNTTRIFRRRNRLNQATSIVRNLCIIHFLHARGKTFSWAGCGRFFYQTGRNSTFQYPNFPNEPLSNAYRRALSITRSTQATY